MLQKYNLQPNKLVPSRPAHSRGRANVVDLGTDVLHSLHQARFASIHWDCQAISLERKSTDTIAQHPNIKKIMTHLDAWGGRASFHMNLCDRNERKARLICKPHRSPLPPFTKTIPPPSSQFHGLDHIQPPTSPIDTPINCS
jgi:hypothetical protein